MSNGPCALYAEEFSSREESRQKVAEFPSYAHAIQAAVDRIKAEMQSFVQPGQSAKQLFDQFVAFGTDIYIVPDDNAAKFSALDLARLLALQLTGDQSRTLFLEATCRDRLITASGVASPVSEWKFRIKAPATYAGAGHLLRRAAEGLYDDMSDQARRSDGSSYQLLEMVTREFTEAEVEEARKEPKPMVCYMVKGNGAFLKCPL